MSGILKSAALVAVTAVIVHLAVILATPNLIMGVALKRLSFGEQKINVWSHGPRTSEASRTVVRPSPDLAYSSCVYDLSKGPVRIMAAKAADYMSVSVYAANSDNIFAINDRQAPNGVQLVLVAKGQVAPTGLGTVVHSPTLRGIVLERRLAPSAEAFAAAAGARSSDVCAAL